MKKLILFLVLSVLLNFNSNADDINEFNPKEDIPKGFEKF